MARHTKPDLATVVLEACANATGVRAAVRCLVARPQDRGGCRLLAGEPCRWWAEAVRPGLADAGRAVAEGPP